MSLEQILTTHTKNAIEALYGAEVEESLINFQQTRTEFEGDLSLVVFPFLRHSKKAPEATAQEVGDYLQEKVDLVEKINVVKGFVNISIQHSYWADFLSQIGANPKFGETKTQPDSQTFMIEYSSPNTNKPLHLGHIRNILLGHSISEILKANGHKVIKTNIVNDRGIHICKSMYAWQKWGSGETPESTGIKGDKLVGNYYVKFDQEYKKEQADLQSGGMSEEEAKKQAPSLLAAQAMLRKWEQNDTEVRKIWAQMNGWVYQGFDLTYNTLGVGFDKIYYESDTYKVGKELVEQGVQDRRFYRKEDSSVWADLTQEGLDEKLLLRADGTSVYMTQDIGTAKMRYDDFAIDKMVYVVGNEQDYHFKVLSILLDKLKFKWGKELKHFSYGMVELPEGKMKSREGTVVDADELVADMTATAETICAELGKLDGLNPEKIKQTARTIALGALKYFILKVDPKKNMMFNPKESIDFNGNTGPFVQYTYARIQSLLRRAEAKGLKVPSQLFGSFKFDSNELEIIKILHNFPAVLKEAGSEFSPAVLANYAYALVKLYNRFYHDNPILKEADATTAEMRLLLSSCVAQTVAKSMHLLGIEVVDRM